MTQDETVNGPRIAAEILNRMNSGRRERIVQAITKSDPEIAKKITVNLFTFEDIATLSTQGVQLLIKEVEQRDLVLSLKSTTAKLKEFLFSNMTERKRASVQDDFKALPPVLAGEVEDAQRRILDRLDQLRTSGKILTRGEHDTWV